MAEPTESLWQTVKGDFRGASGLRILGVAALVAWLAFQWGFGNDALLPSIATWAFDFIDDDTTWPSGITAVSAATLAGFTFWAATQALDAIITLAGLQLVPGIAARISAFVRRKGWVKPYADMKWSTRWVIAYATGASVLCLVDLFATGERGMAQRKHIIVSATLLSAGTVAFVVALVSGAAMVATRVPATEDGADLFIRYAKNPLTWIALFSVVFLVGHLRDRRRSPEEEGVSSKAVATSTPAATAEHASHRAQD